MRIEKSIEVINVLGLHARAATKLVKLCSGFACQIEIIKDGQSADAKSIMAILTLAATKGSQLTLVADGEDAQQASEQIEKLFAQRFGEAE